MYRRRVLIMLAVVLAIGLALLFIDLLARQRMNQDRVYSLNNLREIGLFAQMAAMPGEWSPIGPGKQVEKERLAGLPIPAALPAGTVVNAAWLPERRLSWIVTALPYLNRQRQNLDRLIAEIDLTQSWDSATNRPHSETVVRSLIPTAVTTLPVSGEPGRTYYVGIGGISAPSGPGDAATLAIADPRAGPMRYDTTTPFDAITDGLRQTILIAETAFDNSPWMQGGPGTVRTIGIGPPLGWSAPFGGIHRGFSCVGYADGSAGVLADRMSPDVFRAMGTIHGDDSLIGE